MYRMMMLAAGMLTASAGHAQVVGGPPIAYAKASARGDAIYLVNSDGTGETKVYQAPRIGRFGGQIGRLSLRPGGGEIAFILNNVQLMILEYDGNGQPVGVAYEVDVPGDCSVEEADYRSDGYLHVHDGCSDDWIVAPDATVATYSFAGGNWGALAALGTGLVYVEHAGLDSGNLKLRTASGVTTTITPLTYTMPLYLDAVGNQAVVSQANSFRTVNLTTGAISSGCTAGGMVKYSADGTQMVYEYRNVLFVHNADCSGAPFRLARGAKAVAWRSN